MAKEEEARFHDMVERHVDWDEVEKAGVPAIIAILKGCHLVFHDDGSDEYAELRKYTVEKSDGPPETD